MPRRKSRESLKTLNPNPPPRRWSIIEYLVTYLINNLQFSLTNLHVRFCTQLPTAAGPSAPVATSPAPADGAATGAGAAAAASNGGGAAGGGAARQRQECVLGLRVESLATLADAHTLSSAVFRLLRRAAHVSPHSGLGARALPHACDRACPKSLAQGPGGRWRGEFSRPDPKALIPMP